MKAFGDSCNPNPLSLRFRLQNTANMLFRSSMQLPNRFLLTTVILISSFSEAPAQSTEAKSPEARYLHHMVFDEGAGQMLVYGGTCGYKMFGDLWALNSAGWKKLSDSGPSGRVKAAFAYDRDRKKALLFGGAGQNNQLFDDTWEWNGKEWKQLSVKGPSMRNHALAVYDAKNKVTMLFGGVGPTGLLNDTWAFDGSGWIQVHANGPKDCLPHGMIYDEAKGKTFLITLSVIRDPADDAHAVNTMWEWDGDGWKKVGDGAPITTSSNLQAIAPFGKDTIVLFDGSDVSQNHAKTSVLFQGRWTSSSLDGPAPRVGHGMAYDKTRNRVILFGGGSGKDFLGDTWAWDGKVWSSANEK